MDNNYNNNYSTVAFFQNSFTFTFIGGNITINEIEDSPKQVNLFLSMFEDDNASITSGSFRNVPTDAIPELLMTATKYRNFEKCRKIIHKYKYAN
jgi:hypothetical protein